jgi:hypothetical protein
MVLHPSFRRGEGQAVGFAEHVPRISVDLAAVAGEPPVIDVNRRRLAAVLMVGAVDWLPPGGTVGVDADLWVFRFEYLHDVRFQLNLAT